MVRFKTFQLEAAQGSTSFSQITQEKTVAPGLCVFIVRVLSPCHRAPDVAGFFRDATNQYSLSELELKRMERTKVNQPNASFKVFFTSEASQDAKKQRLRGHNCSRRNKATLCIGLQIRSFVSSVEW